eukprot:m.229893 g.229893  ORF g.229893 m.229893 type:complete len:590 (-) comp17867_c0_seq1:25-1794(-)
MASTELAAKAVLEENHEGDKKGQALSKNAKKKLKKKLRKQDEKQTIESLAKVAEGKERGQESGNETADSGVNIEYVEERVNIDDPSLSEFSDIFARFKNLTEIKAEQSEEQPERKKAAAQSDGEEDDEDEVEIGEDGKIKKKDSKKKLRAKHRLTVAELKQMVPRPDVVEPHDVAAKDPRLLIFLKGLRNTVPVPRHWSFKRRYLQGKRGIEKPPFVLPEFIRRTGIMEARGALAEKDAEKNLKAKQREKIRPKMGKMEIDYQKLHDAFFRFQTRPKMTIHGDIYYEGKEFEVRMRQKRPGDLSDELRNALGMPTNPGAPPFPPPWLLHMQRYGPPPSYPNLKIPGLNAPIPPGASFGYHPGGWGKPPVDEFGRPLYGDVFAAATSAARLEDRNLDANIDKTLWGQLTLVEDYSSSEEEEEEEKDDDEADVQEGTETHTGISTETSGVTSSMAGIDTPEAVELRKRNIESEMDNAELQPLYRVVPQAPASVGGAMMGSSHVYDIRNAVSVTAAGRGELPDGTDISLEDPDELAKLDQDALSKKYAEARQSSGPQHEDFSDMVAEHQRAQNATKRKKDGKDKEKTKKFKF